MKRDETSQPDPRPATPEPDGTEAEFRVDDRRHWVGRTDGDGSDVAAEAEPARPTVLDGYLRRAEEAEARLREYIDAFKKSQDEQEQFRIRLGRDVDRRVELKFGEVLGDLLETLDHLDLALQHVADVPEAKALADGVAMARNRFLSALERHGVRRISPDAETFDPNEAEALRVDPVESPEMDGKVTETLRPGYVLGDLVVRPARVAVGRFLKAAR